MDTVWMESANHLKEKRSLLLFDKLLF